MTWRPVWCADNKSGEHRNTFSTLGGDIRCVCGAVSRTEQTSAVAGAGSSENERPEPTVATQSGRVLAALRRGVVCAFVFYKEPTLTHRLAARVHDLRKMGYNIETVDCKNASHDHQVKAAAYRLVKS